MTGDDEYGYGMGDRESEKRVSLIVVDTSFIFLSVIHRLSDFSSVLNI